jgi:hypothetical protein
LNLICSVCIAAPATTQSAEELPKPTLVTLKLDHTPVTDALTQLFQQADIPSDWLLNPGFAQQLQAVTATGTFEKQPFTQVLLELCRQCWLEPQYSNMPAQPMVLAIRRPRLPIARASTRASTRPASTTRSSNTGGVVVYRTRPRAGMTPAPRGSTQPSWVDAPSMVSGPFVFVATETRRTSQVDLEGDAAPAQTMMLTLMVLRDPKVRVFSISDRLEIETATDEAGRSLLVPPRPDAEARRARVITEGRWNSWNLTVPLTYTEQSHKLALLRGRLITTIITRTEPLEVIKSGAAVSGDKTIGDIHFAIGNLEPMGNDASKLGITIFRPTDGDQARWDEVRGITRSDLFRINDSPTGAGYWINSQIHSFQGNAQYLGAIQFQPTRRNGSKPEKIDKVIWNVPAEFQEFSIPVEFKDLPLP